MTKMEQIQKLFLRVHSPQIELTKRTPYMFKNVSHYFEYADPHIAHENTVTLWEKIQNIYKFFVLKPTCVQCASPHRSTYTTSSELYLNIQHYWQSANKECFPKLKGPSGTVLLHVHPLTDLVNEIP